MNYHVDGTLPPPGYVWVFGSNLAGIHGAGAARVAVDKYGAKFGCGVGPMGMSYAIPTKDQTVLRTLPLETVNLYVHQFCEHTRTLATGGYTTKFFVTRIGCGLAGFQDEQIAPMFARHIPTIYCSFAEEWKKYLD